MRNQEEVRKRRRKRNSIGIEFICVWSRDFGYFGSGLGHLVRRGLMMDLEAAVLDDNYSTSSC